MIQVLFFAYIREQLGHSRLSVPLLNQSTTVEVMVQYLIEHNGESWSQVLGAENVLKAVNHEIVEGDHILIDGDELAFFPPVTGG